MTEQCPLKVLGVPRQATSSQIKKAYKDLAFKYHPDKAAKDDRSQKQAKERFQQVQEAYDKVKDGTYKPPAAGAAAGGPPGWTNPAASSSSSGPTPSYYSRQTNRPPSAAPSSKPAAPPSYFRSKAPEPAQQSKKRPNDSDPHNTSTSTSTNSPEANQPPRKKTKTDTSFFTTADEARARPQTAASKAAKLAKEKEMNEADAWRFAGDHKQTAADIMNKHGVNASEYYKDDFLGSRFDNPIVNDAQHNHTFGRKTTVGNVPTKLRGEQLFSASAQAPGINPQNEWKHVDYEAKKRKEAQEKVRAAQAANAKVTQHRDAKNSPKWARQLANLRARLTQAVFLLEAVDPQFTDCICVYPKDTLDRVMKIRKEDGEELPLDEAKVKYRLYLDKIAYTRKMARQNAKVSATHCYFQQQVTNKDLLYIEDVSSNGTFVSGKKIPGNQIKADTAKDGAMITFGAATQQEGLPALKVKKIPPLMLSVKERSELEMDQTLNMLENMAKPVPRELLDRSGLARELRYWKICPILAKKYPERRERVERILEDWHQQVHNQ